MKTFFVGLKLPCDEHPVRLLDIISKILVKTFSNFKSTEGSNNNLIHLQ